MSARTRGIGSSLSRKTRTESRMASCSGLGMRSIRIHSVARADRSPVRAAASARKSENAVADDVALDVLRTGGDGRGEGDQVVAHPARRGRPVRAAQRAAGGVPSEDLGAEDL